MMTTNTRTLRLKRLVVGLSAALALVDMEIPAFALSLTAVTSCADDSSPGTLRHIIAGAASGTEIDMSEAWVHDQCSTKGWRQSPLEHH